jgi:hypothetical protein
MYPLSRTITAIMPSKNPRQTPPTLDPATARRALKSQLVALDALKGRNASEAEDDEREWEHLTQSIVERAFGIGSSNLSKFRNAQWAGSHAVREVEFRDFHQEQINYDERQRAFTSLLRSLIAELELLLPPEEIRGIYEGGDAYEFYRDVSSLFAAATREIFIVDAYLDENVFDLYLAKIPTGTPVRLLTGNLGKDVLAVATLYAKGKPLQLRTSNGVHDRVVFIDGRGWLIGQSIKDAAHKKPTTVSELLAPRLTIFRSAHEKLWTAATVAI